MTQTYTNTSCTIKSRYYDAFWNCFDCKTQFHVLEPSHCEVQDHPRVSTSFQLRELYLSTWIRGALYLVGMNPHCHYRHHGCNSIPYSLKYPVYLRYVYLNIYIYEYCVCLCMYVCLSVCLSVRLSVCMYDYVRM